MLVFLQSAHDSRSQCRLCVQSKLFLRVVAASYVSCFQLVLLSVVLPAIYYWIGSCIPAWRFALSALRLPTGNIMVCDMTALLGGGCQPAENGPHHSKDVQVVTNSHHLHISLLCTGYTKSPTSPVPHLQNSIQPLPAHSRLVVLPYRAWFDKAGPIPYAGDTSLGPIQPRHVVLNHWEQHCKTCKSCQEGVRLLKRLEYGCYAAGKAIFQSSKFSGRHVYQSG